MTMRKVWRALPLSSDRARQTENHWRVTARERTRDSGETRENEGGHEESAIEKDREREKTRERKPERER